MHTILRVGALLVAALFSACAPAGNRTPGSASPEVTAAIQRAALHALFLDRERAASVVLFSDSSAAGPIFSELGEEGVRSAATPAGLQQHRITLAELEQIFAEHVDGWAAFFRRYPRSAGLVEVSQVLPGDSGTASIVIARSCGEHCRMAWRVTVALEEPVVADARYAADPEVVSITALSAVQESQ